MKPFSSDPEEVEREQRMVDLLRKAAMRLIVALEDATEGKTARPVLEDEWEQFVEQVEAQHDMLFANAMTQYGVNANQCQQVSYIRALLLAAEWEYRQSRKQEIAQEGDIPF